jgi:hypothetical protein
MVASAPIPWTALTRLLIETSVPRNAPPAKRNIPESALSGEIVTRAELAL